MRVYHIALFIVAMAGSNRYQLPASEDSDRHVLTVYSQSLTCQVTRLEHDSLRFAAEVRHAVVTKSDEDVEAWITLYDGSLLFKERNSGWSTIRLLMPDGTLWSRGALDNYFVSANGVRVIVKEAGGMFAIVDKSEQTVSATAVWLGRAQVDSPIGSDIDFIADGINLAYVRWQPDERQVLLSYEDGFVGVFDTKSLTLLKPVLASQCEEILGAPRERFLQPDELGQFRSSYEKLSLYHAPKTSWSLNPFYSQSRLTVVNYANEVQSLQAPADVAVFDDQTVSVDGRPDDLLTLTISAGTATFEIQNPSSTLMKNMQWELEGLQLKSQSLELCQAVSSGSTLTVLLQDSYRKYFVVALDLQDRSSSMFELPASRFAVRRALALRRDPVRLAEVGFPETAEIAQVDGEFRYTAP
jgi:hypothetical protein